MIRALRCLAIYRPLVEDKQASLPKHSYSAPRDSEGVSMAVGEGTHGHCPARLSGPAIGG